jgi:cyclopropane-fatty-acyl-phospholipid synthase
MASQAEIFRLFVDESSPVGFRGSDGSSARGNAQIAVLEVRSPKAFGHLLRAPGELGLVRAYVTGAFEVRGDLYLALRGLSAHRRRPRPREVARLLAEIPWGELRRASVPEVEAPSRWHRGLVAHTRRRDAVAIAHHYDLSNRFYELVLGPSMAYSCAVFAEPEMSLDQAQEEKFDLICRKLGLRAGQRLLDVGAGWGGMVIHAAANYGVRAEGVTLSAVQTRWAQKAIAAAGLAGRAEVRLLDYRDVPEADFDAIASIGAMEHFGSRQLASYFASMAARLRPAGRMLNHCITRPSNRQAHHPGPFIERYIFPDGELQGPGAVISAMHDNGFEVRHAENLREHYARTLREWGANLERNWREAVAAVGEQRARAWRLYIATCRLGFERGRVQIHQVLGVRTGPGGNSGMPPRPNWDDRRNRTQSGDGAAEAALSPAAWSLS